VDGPWAVGRPLLVLADPGDTPLCDRAEGLREDPEPPQADRAATMRRRTRRRPPGHLIGATFGHYRYAWV